MKRYLLSLLLIPAIVFGATPFAVTVDKNGNVITTNMPASGVVNFATGKLQVNGVAVSGGGGGSGGISIDGTPTAGGIGVWRSATSLGQGTNSEVINYADDGNVALLIFDGPEGIFSRFRLTGALTWAGTTPNKFLNVLYTGIDMTGSNLNTFETREFSDLQGINGLKLYDDAATPLISADFDLRQLRTTDDEVVLEWSEVSTRWSGQPNSDHTLRIGWYPNFQSDIVLWEGFNIINWNTGFLNASENKLSANFQDRQLVTTNHIGGSEVVVLDWSSLSTIALGSNVAISFDGTGAATTRTNLGVSATGADTNYVKLNQTSGQTIGSTGSRLTKLWATDLTVTNAISGSVTGNAATVTTNANLTGDVTSSGNATTIAASAVTLAKMANITGPVILGRTTADGVGAPKALTLGTGVLTALQITPGSAGAVVLNGSIVGAIGITVDGAGSTITTGVKGYFTVPYAGTITGWSITADGSSPTCTFDVWKIATGTALPTVSNTIMGTNPALSTGNAKRSSTLTSWNPTTFSAGDIFGFNVDAVTVATKITFILEVTK